MIAILLFLFALVFPLKAYAIYDPASVPNNKYGIHVVDTNDFANVTQLVNSTGGDWGYVTMVLPDAQRDHDRWQKIFNEMRRLHLIPIIRLATHVENTVWVKPTKDRFYEIVKLLNSLNWPTENRYVLLYNEPNHANEWGGQINPEEYADDLVAFGTALKEANSDFFILPAGLDASAGDGTAMDETEYLRRMIAAKPEILTLIDGWTSHSYPNPGFSGSPYATGRGTLTTYQWELSYLSTLGLTRELPVFITETGWQHSEGKVYAPGFLSSDQVGANLQIASQTVWNDSLIVAVTPFLFNYQDVPFDHFSFQQLGTDNFYNQYYAYQAIAKIKGVPRQHESYTLTTDLLPGTLVSGSIYTLTAEVKNDGQGILDPKDAYTVFVMGDDISGVADPVPLVEPGSSGTITIRLKTPDRTGPRTVEVVVRHNQENILPPPSVEIHANLGWRKTSEATDVTVLLYDKNTLLQKFTGLTMKNGAVTAWGLTNIIPGNLYRVVTLVHGYLPRQTITALGSKITTLYPKRFLPLDFNNDGTFTFADILALIRVPPWTALLRFFGP
ncbi:MAG: hypothetical protein NT149_03275 [Candidatus Gottesmanbacteria bacterium]|nr:hypothetical protein [Candidatus Gottesmanbacteria bacterium]